MERRRGARGAVRRALAAAGAARLPPRARPGLRRGDRAGLLRRRARALVAAARSRQGTGLPAPKRGQPLAVAPAAPGRRTSSRRPGGSSRAGRRRRPLGVRPGPAEDGAGRPAPAPPSSTRGARPALLPRPLRGRDRGDPRDQPGRGQEPRVPRRGSAARRAGYRPRGDPMSDDPQLRQLLSDAVSDIEPHDRIARIRASVRPDPSVPTSHARSWRYAVAGIAATAAVIGVVAYVSSVAGDDPTVLGPSAQGGSGPGHQT